MRRSLAVILSTATLGTMVAATGCAERRYQTSTPYYDSPYYGYNGWDAAEQARYREWLAERRYQYLEFNRLSSERQREYWAWRNSRYGQSVQDRYRDYNRQRVEQEREQRERDQNRYVRNRDNDQRYARDRDDRRYTRDRDDRNRVYRNHSNNRDHDRKANDRDRDRDHDRDHR